MADPAHEWTDQKLLEVERHMADSYKTAYKQADAEARHCAKDYQRELKRWQKDVAEGRKTAKEFKAWRETEAAHGQWWRELANRLSKDYAQADAKAKAIANGEAAEVYAENVNYATYDVETQGQVDTAFSLYDADTVRTLAEDQRDLLPTQTTNVEKDVIWNRQHLASAVTQSVLLGESVPDLAKRLQSVADMDKRAATRAARTSLTAAENAGRAMGYKRAVDMGIQLKVQWIATKDSRTRDSHRKLDGEVVEVGERFSNGLLYPGDPDGPASEVWNCRCTTGAAEVFGVNLTDAEGMPARLARDNPEEYARWKAGHGGGKKEEHASGRSVASFMAMPSVKERIQKAGLSEKQTRDLMREQMRADGHNDLRAFQGMTKRQQQETFSKAISAERGITRKRNASQAAKVDLAYVKSRAYIEKFDGLTGNAAADRAIALECQRMLIHRSGTNAEDLALINKETGEVVARSSGGGGVLQTRYTKEVRDAIKNNPKGSLISVHNHPSNIPPTGSDFGSLMAHEYASGVVALHNGDAYLFKVVKGDFSGLYFDRKVNNVMTPEKPEADAILEVIDQLEKWGSIRWRRV